jgi:acetyl-CoA carboxylase biotin carboxylase subunit
MTDELREKMGEAAVKAAEFIGYEGVGTIEFLVDKHRNFYFMEMNTRIQVEHPITEQVIDYDLIREQILLAAGTPISGINYYPKLHSIECRINAEDPYRLQTVSGKNHRIKYSWRTRNQSRYSRLFRIYNSF